MQKGTVSCPICSQQFEAHLIESHAEQCLEKHLESETRNQIRKDEIVAEKLAKKLSSLKPGQELDEQTLKEIEKESQIQLERETGSVRKSLPPQQLENLDNIYLPIPKTVHYHKSSAPAPASDPQPKSSPPLGRDKLQAQLQKPLPPAPREIATPPPTLPRDPFVPPPIPQRVYSRPVYLTPQHPYPQQPPQQPSPYPQQPSPYPQQPSPYPQPPQQPYPQQAPAPYRQVVPQSPLQAYAPTTYQQSTPQYPPGTYQQAPSQYPYVQYQQVVYNSPPAPTPTQPYPVYQAYPGAPPPFYAPASYPASPPVQHQPVTPLESPPSESKTGVIKQGWVRVSVGSQNNFSKKWVVLHYKKFMLYETAQQNPTGISLEGCIVNEIDTCMFQLSPPTSQAIFCTTESPLQCQEWMQALSQAEVAVVNKSQKGPTLGKEINDGWILMTLKNGINTVKNEVFTSQDAKQIDEAFMAKIQQLQQNPQEQNVIIHGHFVTILSNAAHKFGKDIPKFVQNWQKKAKKALKSPKIEEDVYTELTTEVTTFIATELDAFEAHYPGLADISEDSMHYCYVAMESILFPKINDELFLLVKKRFIADDANCMKKVSAYRTIGPAHLGIPPEYWLVPQELDARRSMDDVPYMKAISSLQQLSALDTPTKKFECLIRTAKNIILSIQEYYATYGHPDNKKVNTELGADDLLPLFTYVVVKSNVPFIFSESKYMEQFITDKVAIEQGGYLAATLQTCLTFITSLSDKQLESTASELLDKVEKDKQKQLERKDPVNSLAQQLASDVKLNTSSGSQQTGNLIEFN